MSTVDYEEMMLEVKDEMGGDDMWPDTELEAAAHMLAEGHVTPFKED